MVFVNRTILHESKGRAVLRVVTESNKWLMVNLFILLIAIVELKTMHFFHVLALPEAFLVMYSTIVTAASTFCGLSAMGHLVFICRSLTHLVVRRWSKGQRSTSATALMDPSVVSLAYGNSNIFGPTVFSPLTNSSVENSPTRSALHSCWAAESMQPHVGVATPFDLDVSPMRYGQLEWTRRPSGPMFVAETGTHCLNRSPEGNLNTISLLDIALSPIVGPPLRPESGPFVSLGKIARPDIVNMTRMNMPFTWNAIHSNTCQYQTSSSPPSSPNCGLYNDHLSTKSPTLITQTLLGLNYSPSDTVFGDLHTRPGSLDQITERSSCEYWKEHGITEAHVEKYVIALRMWLHGTIFRRLVDEIATINRHLGEASGNDALIGSVTMNTLQELCSTKYQYLPSLPILLSFLELMTDHGYLVNRLKELARGCYLEEFRWDSGSRSASWPWKEHLPNDSLILLHMFATYMDLRIPPHPKCPAGRVFTHLCIVRHPDKPDLNSRYNIQLYQWNVQPPHFSVVLDGKMYAVLSGQHNLFHAILMCFHHSFIVDGKLRSVSLGPSGLNIAWIFSK